MALIVADELVDPALAHESAFDSVPLLTPRDAKGLEFDHAIVVEPALIADREQGLRELYVALTRPTTTLVVVYARPLPAELGSTLASMPDLWTPAMPGPLDDLVARIHRRIEAFATEHELDRAMVEVELSDGALLRLVSLSPEPGYGFLTLVPHSEDGEPQELIVPLGAIRQLTLSRAEPQSPVGFSLPDG